MDSLNSRFVKSALTSSGCFGKENRTTACQTRMGSSKVIKYKHNNYSKIKMSMLKHFCVISTLFSVCLCLQERDSV